MTPPQSGRDPESPMTNPGESLFIRASAWRALMSDSGLIRRAESISGSGLTEQLFSACRLTDA